VEYSGVHTVWALSHPLSNEQFGGNVSGIISLTLSNEEEEEDFVCRYSLVKLLIVEASEALRYKIYMRYVL